MGTISVIGSINMDIVMRSSRMPREGESLIVLGADYVPGGKGANQAVAVSRLGGKARMAGRLGCDGFGEQLLRALEAAGVDASCVVRDPSAHTGLAVIVVLDNGANSILVAPGANMAASLQDAEQWMLSASQSDIVMLQLEIPIEIVEYVIRECQQRSIIVILDAGPAGKCPPEVVAGVDVITPNETEAEALTGIRVDSLDSARRAAGALLEMGARCVVLKLGANGSLLARGSEMTHFPAFEVPAVDSTAAGDAFTGALAVRLSEGADIRTALPFANAAGALAATRIGAQPSIPSRDEVERFLEERARVML